MESSSTHLRTLVKSVTYRAVATIVDIIIVFVLTGRIDIALAFGGATIIISSATYFLHERAWSYVSWGRNGKN